MTDRPEPPESPKSPNPSVTPETPQSFFPAQAAQPVQSTPAVPATPEATLAGAVITSEDRRWNLIAHYGAAVILVLTVGTCGALAGLLTLFLKGASPIVRAHALESLNFQLTWGIFTSVGIVAALLTSWTCLGLLLGLSALLSGGFACVFAIIAGRYAARGVLYRYPVSFRVIV